MTTISLAENVRIERDRTKNEVVVWVLDAEGAQLSAFRLAPEHAYAIARDLQKAAAYGLAQVQREQEERSDGE